MLHLVNVIAGTTDLSHFPASIAAPGVPASCVVVGILQIDTPIGIREGEAGAVAANPVVIQPVAHAVIDLNSIQGMVAYHIALDRVAYWRDAWRTKSVNIDNNS